MKKVMFISCILLLLSGALFATGNAEEREPVVLSVMAVGDNSNVQGISWNRLEAAFMEENPDIIIESELLFGEPYFQKVSARLAAGDIPHVAYMGADERWGAAWQEADQQIDHNPYIPSFIDPNLIPEMGPRGSCLMSIIIPRISGDPRWVSKAVAGEYSFDDPVMVESLALIQRMVNDGVISSDSLLVDYGTSIANFSNGQALFLVQGHWAASAVENPEVRDNMRLLAWPTLPGEQPGFEGSVAAAWQVGYGITRAGTEDEAVFEAALRLLNYINREVEATQRLRDGIIVAPIIAEYTVPSDLPNEFTQKVLLSQNAPKPNSDVIDAYLPGAANEALNAGMQRIVAGEASPEEVANEVASLR